MAFRFSRCEVQDAIPFVMLQSQIGFTSREGPLGRTYLKYATAQHVEPQAGFLTTAWLRLSTVSITDIDGQPPTSSLLRLRYLWHPSSWYNFANSIRSRRVITPCKCIDGSSTPGPTAIAAANFAMTGSIFMRWTIPLVLYASKHFLYTGPDLFYETR